MTQIIKAFKTLRHPLAYASSTASWFVANFILCAVGAANSQAQIAEPVVVVSQSQIKNHLRIDWGISNANYRQQLFNLTPLGSSYRSVASFVRAEILTEHSSTSKSDLVLELTLTRAPALLDRRNQYMRDEPPRTTMIASTSKYKFQAGAAYLATNYRAKPSILKSYIQLGVLYIFDSQSKLIDIYCGQSTAGKEL